MSDPAGSAVAAIQKRQAELASRQQASAEADRILAEALSTAHQTMRDSVRQLDAITTEIEALQQSDLVVDTPLGVVDTPLGAREYHTFLLGKQREIAAIVATAREISQAKSVVLQGLRGQYLT
ncbi:DUF4226 domain-containing protein [Mycobacterium asiaticum]|uniref:DUF4226 domain-containing protein n=1 Tax=Mycobacterium asiaticum TaxID=1790 RepID=A0A1A3MML9_MYCAS|nr:DUF4226 domain-containing protein [Mycobacterium asiaticum]OBK10751.1 hypothetical protein A5636_14865 [Mycobacterium asiaticum]